MKIYMNPELVTCNADTEMYTPASWLETVVGSVAGGVASGVTGAIVADSIPGPAVPG
ncbi:hypothetical protein [Clostridium estertheticum]|uniref:hypothetical protein n=1 Tax=Clostridium estertheticum TaxID=238834 RepID=UPI0014795C43|nr:hypothetical protein [Clostridium estertheticum]MBU3171915.1 hypothetical protein [Clostridium estertheticum]MBZ9618365.1 hypothetical protein [Clostridium estertheticum subsp. laramiense]WAG76138.1 hypothetical protein LL032_23405 [Clostridium estertheticum]